VVTSQLSVAQSAALEISVEEADAPVCSFSVV
jgi:hypothetical protein